VEVGASKFTGVEGSHNKPIGCSASGTYAPVPDDEKEDSLAICDWAHMSTVFVVIMFSCPHYV
jgi:hypothetical protein